MELIVMNDEIKEIKIGMYSIDEILEFMTNGEGRGFMGRSMYDAILDYITNLQQELKEANESITWWSNRFKAIQQENERLKANIRTQKSRRRLQTRKKNDYKSRCEKAIEYIKENEFYLDYKTGACIKGVMPLLNILQNGSDTSVKD